MKVLEGIRDHDRVQATRTLTHIGDSRGRVLERLVSLAADLADAPIALITLIDDETMTLAAHSGLPEELVRIGSLPIEYSICQYAINRGKPLIVGDARLDDLLEDHPAVRTMGVVAYAGIPVVLSSGEAVGTLCVIDMKARLWSDDILARMALLADLVGHEFDLHNHERAAAFRRTWRGVPELSRW